MDSERMSEGRSLRILVVPGFVIDTFSEIERSYVELTANAPDGLEFIWLVPDVTSPYNAFAKEESRAELREPVYRPHLRRSNIAHLSGTISKYNLFANLLLFHRLFSRCEIDAVYTHFGFERFWATFLAKLWGKTTIWNEHWHSLGRRYAWFKRIFYRFFVDEFISVSAFIARTLPPNVRVHTVPNAVHAPKANRAELEGSKGQLRERLGKREGAQIVLMVAAFRAEKRHLLALEICEEVLAVRRDVAFVFPGSGPLRETFLDAVHQRGLQDRLCVPGYVDNIDDYYAIADVFMLTSKDEPFGYVVLEAMRHGLPVIAFNSGGPSEVIEHEHTGFLLEEGRTSAFASILIELLSDSERGKVVGRRAQAVVRHVYNRERWIVDLNRVLLEIVSQRKSGAKITHTHV